MGWEGREGEGKEGEGEEISIHSLKLVAPPMVSLRLSIRLSHSCVASKRIQISSNFSLGLIAISFWSLVAIRFYAISGGIPSARALNTRRLEICDFRLTRRLSRKRYETGRRLPWNVNTKS